MYLIQMKKLKNKLILTQDKYKMLDKYTDSGTMEEIPNTLVAKNLEMFQIVLILYHQI